MLGLDYASPVLAHRMGCEGKVQTVAFQFPFLQFLFGFGRNYSLGPKVSALLIAVWSKLLARYARRATVVAIAPALVRRRHEDESKLDGQQVMAPYC